MYFYERTKKTYTQTACKLVLHHHNKPKISQSLLYHQLTEFPLWQVTNRTFICNVSTYWYSIRIFSSDFLTLSPSSIKTVLFFVLPLHLACELIKIYLGNLYLFWWSLEILLQPFNLPLIYYCAIITNPPVMEFFWRLSSLIVSVFGWYCLIYTFSYINHYSVW